MSKAHQVRSDCSVIIGIRADSRGFTDAYVSVENSIVEYELGTWVHTHDVWVHYERHNMIHMLLTGALVLDV
jgi:hypothetical protein